MNEKTSGKRLPLLVLLAGALTMLALPPAALHAQETWPMGTGLGLFGGYARPSDDLYEGAVAYGFNLSYVFTPNLAVELSGFRFESAVKGSTDGLSEGKLAVMPVQLSVQGRFPMKGGRLIPFVEAGAGYYINKFSLDSGLASDWAALGFDMEESVESVVGYHFGAGVDFFVSGKISLGAEVKYCIATAQGTWRLADAAGGAEASGELKDLGVGPLAFGIRLKYVLK